MNKRIYLSEHMLGVFVLSENGDILYKVFRPLDIDQLAEIIIRRRSGEADEALIKLLDILKEKEPDSVIVIEEPELARIISERNLKVEISTVSKPLIMLRSEVEKIYLSEGLFKSLEELRGFMHRVSIEATRRELRSVVGRRDLLAIQSIRAVDDIDKTLNLFSARLREWYSVHFPELDELVEDHIQYARIVYEIGSRDNMTVEKLKSIGVSESLARKIISASEKSMGSDISEADLDSMRSLARIMLELNRIRSDLTNYLSSVMREVAPNVTALVGPTLGARLLSLAGSLEELAKSPASTIQVLGAEKALFRALRTGGKPPKHGILFQHPEIHRAPRWQRGKIARALATKLAIAARVDYYSGRYIGDKLREALEQRIEEIKKIYAKPPPREERTKPPKPPPKKKRGEGKEGR
ncbi:MAG: C/D box methylation guide ribonucleoprotein complex aNOP56 subunit [Sulfolobales archaeon]